MILIALLISLLGLLFVIFGIIPYGLYVYPMIGCGVYSAVKTWERVKSSKQVLIDIKFWTWVTLFLGTFIAPLIHFSENKWIIRYSTPPSDWKPWAFIISTIYFCGFVLLDVFLKKKIIVNKTKDIWILNPQKMKVVYIMMFVSFILQTYIYATIGGITGYINAFDENDGGFEGMGMIFIISELFPLVYILYFFLKYKGKQISTWKVYLFLVLLFVSCLYFGGFRGSRSNTLLTVFQGVIVIHYAIKPFTKKQFISFFCAGMLFMIIGKMYKTWGSDFTSMSYSEISSSQHYADTGDIITGDLARYDVHAFTIYKLENTSTYKLKYGATYISDILNLVPGPLKPSGLSNKTAAGTELFFNQPYYNPKLGVKSPRIYGMVGQWMLNFGWETSVLSFIVLALLLNFLTKIKQKISFDDTRFFLVSLVILYVIYLINNDMGTTTFLTLKRFLPMYFIIYLVSDKIKRIS